MIVFRHCDRRYPFMWEGDDQPAARWHGPGEGPVHYFADTPDGAWAEFIRHEEITDPHDLDGVVRTLWAVEIGATDELAIPHLDEPTLRGGQDSYRKCRIEAARLRREHAVGMRAPAAALVDDSAGGERVDGGLVEGTPRRGEVFVFFGPRPDFVGWRAATGAPDARVLVRVRQFA